VSNFTHVSSVIRVVRSRLFVSLTVTRSFDPSNWSAAPVGVAVAVLVGVFVGVRVGVDVLVAVGVFVLVRVGVEVTGAGVGVGVTTAFREMRISSTTGLLC
jgi:hypothetical protein